MTNSRSAQIKGLYAITPNELNTAKLLNAVKLALQGGAQVLQYRNKLADTALQLQQALALRKLTANHAVTFIINDDAHLALAAAADGVHLGSEDGSVAVARQVLGENKMIGVSCYNRPELAHAAMQQGADYVAFGAFYASTVKPQAVQAELDMLHQVRSSLNVPIVAIGGITQHNGLALIRAGADALAVISALWQAPNVELAARQFSNLFEQGIPA